MNINEYMNFIESTSTSTYGNIVCNGLHRLHNYGIISGEYEKESESDDCYGRIYNSRGYCKDTQEIGRHYHTVASARETPRVQSRRHLGYQKNRFRELARTTRQFQEARRQKIKPPHQWLVVKDFTAVSLPLKAWNPGRDKPWCTLPTFSIASTLSEVKVIQGMGTK